MIGCERSGRGTTPNKAIPAEVVARAKIQRPTMPQSNRVEPKRLAMAFGLRIVLRITCELRCMSNWVNAIADKDKLKDE